VTPLRFVKVLKASAMHEKTTFYSYKRRNLF